ncbi:MAG: hypothetical protein O3A81_03845 [bacterium]|nr:hypothetical protein [bacterium]
MPRLWIQITSLIAITIAVYMNAPQGQFMNIDDNILIYNNPKVQELTLANIKEIFTTFDPELYIPFTLLSYQIEYYFVGEHPSLFHTTNVILHLFNVLLVFALIRFFNKKWFVPFITAALFAVHPLNTEAVMWISGRKDLLSAFFFLGSLVMYCRYKVRGDRLSFYGSVLLFICALMSKIVAVSLPLIIMLIDDMLPSKNTEHKAVKILAFGIPAFIFLWIGMIGKMLTVFILSYTESIILAFKGVYFYLQKLLLPTHLSIAYEQLTPIQFWREDFLFPILILTAITVISIASRAFGKAFSFGMMWFALTLIPNLGNAVKGSGSNIYYASDRYAYIASIGIFFVAAFGVAWLIQHSRPLQQYMISGVTMIAISLYALSAHNYAVLWLTPKGYHEHSVQLNPEYFLPRMLLGMSYLHEEKNKEAIPHFEKAVERKPKHANPKAQLGLALVKTGEVDRGIVELEKSLKLNSTHAYSYAYLSYAYMINGEDKKARELLEKALENEPESPNILQMYGTLEYHTGNFKNAEKYFRSSIAYNPTSIQSKAALARLLQELK